MSRSKVVIENNLKPSQFGKLASGGDDFDDIYEDPLEKSKPSQPIHGASSGRTEERYRNEPEVMEFSNARISRANSEVPATSSKDQDNFHRESEIAVDESTTSDKQDNRNSKGFSVSIEDNRNSQRFENAVENIAVANNETTSGSKERLTENPESEKTKKQDKADISLRTIIDIVKSLDANRYATKKTIAQGMLDIALLTANASQLKYILQVGTQHEFYILMLSLICVSIGLQILSGLLSLSLNLMRDCRMEDAKYAISVEWIGRLRVTLSFVVFLDNLLIAAFDPTGLAALLSSDTIAQAVVGILYLIVGGLDINRERDHRAALILNDLILVGVFLISLVNVLVSGFDKILGVILGVLLIMLDLKRNETVRRVQLANHAALAVATGATFCDVVKMTFGFDPALIQGIICVLLGSSLNINKQQDQGKANIWNNICLTLMVLTVAVNAVISAFDMRGTNSITSGNTPAASTQASGVR